MYAIAQAKLQENNDENKMTAKIYTYTKFKVKFSGYEMRVR